MEVPVVLSYDRGRSGEELPPEEVLTCEHCGWTLALGYPTAEGEIPLPGVAALYPPFVRRMYDANQRNEEWWMSPDSLPARLRGESTEGPRPPDTAIGPILPADVRAWALAWMETIRLTPSEKWQAFVHEIIWQGYDPDPSELPICGTAEEWANRLVEEFQRVVLFTLKAERHDVQLKARIGAE